MKDPFIEKLKTLVESTEYIVDMDTHDDFIVFLKKG